jgi:hypothetical protein
MTNNKKICQFYKLAWEPVPWFEGGRYLAGNELPNNSLENVRGISLCPQYSNKQIRKIDRIRKERADIGNRKANKEFVYQ